MEKTKPSCVYLEETQMRYLSLLSVITGLNKSQLLRDMIDNDMAQNEELVKTYEKILYR
jgi:hypothetical protein